MVTNYSPERGDCIWLNFNPQTGREQSGRRPALVLSPKAYNEKVGLCLVVPITSKRKGYPFENELDSVSEISGVILADQIRSLDWRVRQAQLIGKVSGSTIQAVLEKIHLIL
ncbi:endoribonuclease MazF [bacterium]|nr:MAG: endoribonuclease MazF [bacterium]